jgi:putative aldouronate transport system substrate-binding protein
MLVLSFSAQAQDGIATPAGEFPIVTEPTVITILLNSGDAHVSDFNTNDSTQWLEETTGLDLQIEVVLGTDAQTKHNLALASGDLPDILLGMPMTPSLLSQQGAEGTFIPLNDLMEEYGFETKRVFQEERPQLLPLNLSPDGNLYGLPEINECFHCFLSQKLWVYKPWLDTLGIDIPTTTDEFEQMLIAFKEQDPNGNGVADEVPFSGSVEGQGGWHNSVDQNLMNAFVFYDNKIQHDRLLLIDGKVEAAFAQPGYREGLRYLHRLYTEGLIDPNGLIQDNAALLQLGSQMEPHLLGAVTGGWQGSFTIPQTVAQGGGEMDNWIAIPPLQGPEGVQTAAYAPWGFSVGRCVITNKAAHPDVAFRLCDLMYSNEATMRNVFGVEDLDWVRPPEGELGIDGSQAAYRTLGNWDADITNTHWRQVGMTYRTSEFRLSQSAVDQFVEVPLYEASNAMLPFAPPLEDLIPPLTFGDDVAGELTEVQLSVRTYADEMLTRFITGDADIETEWDAYLETLNSQGLPRLLEIYQAAYDAQMGVGS